ncbi:MAG: hypothetical protein SGILL_009986 [Bacillariaceae sp.]
MRRIASRLFADSKENSLPFLHKLNVRFSDTCNVRSTISRSDYTQEEISNCWYSEEENNVIKDKCFSVIRKAEEAGGGSGDEKSKKGDSCTRGLESFFYTNYMVKMQTRREAKHAVFLTQDEPGATVKLIGAVYAEFTSSSALWARRTGLLDQKASESCYGEEAQDLFRAILQYCK